MAETPSADKELRYRHVTVHGDGRKLNGTLYLHRHHLCFSYYADVPKDGPLNIARSKSSQGDEVSTQTPSEDSALSVPSTNSSATDTIVDPHPANSASVANGSITGRKHEDSQVRPKQRPKELWVPYPMIYSCVLRPSHAPAQSARPRDESGHAIDGEDDLFPPTFGTASYGRPSTDSARLGPYSSPSRSTSPGRQSTDTPPSKDSGRQPAIRIKCRDFKMMALHFHETQSGPSADEVARQAFYVLRSRGCVNRVEDMHAFDFRPPKEESTAAKIDYDARREYARMGISGKGADGPGTAWRISEINHDYSYSATYPKVLCLPKAVSDNMLKYGGPFRSRSRIPCLAYLHSNGGSITRSSQPMVGLQNKRNPQDERLVSAIFSSHTAPLQPSEGSTPQNLSTTSLPGTDPGTTDGGKQCTSDNQSDTKADEPQDEKAKIPQKKVYGSTRRNLIVDARPKVNAYMNRAGGGGVEDVSNYTGNGGMPVELAYLNIANIHVMRKSLEKVVDSFANSDYIKFKPSEETLRNSGWLSHIANMLDGGEMVARVVGLGGSHVLLHCSDGWDRTAQVSALAQIMLDPHARTVEGFITLIQKDFLSFGHKFRDRDGIEGCEKWYEIENERIAPRDGSSSDPNSLNKFGAKAFTGARNWIEKSRGNLFRQQNSSKDSLGDRSPSRSASPPPNPVVHSSPSPTSREEKKHKTSDQEISPMFHQFLDAVYQLLYQYEDAFEFNERFLRRLFFHAYSCQYGEFLFNNEQERSKHHGKLPSVWPHFLSRKAEFRTPNYVAETKDPLLFPKRRGFDREVEVRWWHNLFGRKDEEMNVPRALAPADPPAVTPTLGTSVSFDVPSAGDESEAVGVPANDAIKEAKSTPNLSAMTAGITSTFSALGLQNQDKKSDPASTPPKEQQLGDFEVLAKQAETTEGGEEAKAEPASRSLPKMEEMEYDGDPLGVSSGKANNVEREGLDFAAFASQNAFRDR